ncbi:thyroid transcription factor 1-associated protein 26 homolog [Heptranchias perlo]|uniref:thyroid transcription factor 1-associated protein 26 homolog n=1 Tax=Heptranchias perlo TaxID=212740 RepID=UPI00355A016D
MAPSNRWRESGSVSSKGKRSKGPAPGNGARISKQKHQWKADHFKKGWGSVKEGQGFAFQRKEKIKHEYKKLLRKEKKAQHPPEVHHTEDYPDHLRHLYLAEEELLKKQSKKAKDNRILTDQPDSQAGGTKKKKNKSSYQKTKEEYEKIQAEHIKQKEAAEKSQREKEEAQRKYKEQKLEKYRILSKKTKKGQPNLNIQIEYLLKKIQESQGTK